VRPSVTWTRKNNGKIPLKDCGKILFFSYSDLSLKQSNYINVQLQMTLKRLQNVDKIQGTSKNGASSAGRHVDVLLLASSPANDISHRQQVFVVFAHLLISYRHFFVALVTMEEKLRSRLFGEVCKLINQSINQSINKSLVFNELRLLFLTRSLAESYAHCLWV